MTVRTRFAPSPTGTPESIHLGFVIRALWNYAFAKKNNGQFILRIEDTDKKRSRRDTEVAIYESLRKFSINWDEGPDVGGPYGPYRQSERLDKYKKAAQLLIKKGYAYYDFDAEVREKEEIKSSYSSKEKLKELKLRPKAREIDPIEAQKRVDNGESYVVRVKIPIERRFEFNDWILKKKISVLGEEVSDLIILKSDGYPTYHLAVVVDDIDMKISHVFRGQEWISTTPIHLYLYEGLEHPVPEIGHFSVIIDPRTNKKFSKRDMSALFGINTWLDKGYLPDALLNYLMLLGWAPKDNRELFTLDEFVSAFDQDGVQKSNPTFDVNKLNWMNQQYIQKTQISKLRTQISDFFEGKYNEDLIDKIVPLIQTRISTLAEFETMAGFFFERKTVDKELLKDGYQSHIESAIETLEKIETWSLDALNTDLMQMIKIKGYKVGDFFMTLRIAITGSKSTPPINESMEILGKEETIERLKQILI